MDWTSLINQLLEKMTQKEVADTIDCSQPFISLLSQGKRKNVEYSTGQKIISLCVLHGIAIYQNQKAPATANS